MVTKTVFTASAINLFALSSVLVVGFALGKLAARRDRQQEANQQQQQEQCYPRAIRGAKRKARIRKSEDSSRAKAAGLGSPLSGEKNSTKKLSRRTRNRNKKLAPKDLALNAFTKVAQAYIPCIGAGDYESLCLLPRAAFILTGRFVPYVECCEHLVTLGLARSATAGVESLRVLYISCAWASDGEQGVWAARDFETARVFLQRNPDLSHVYVGRSCVASNPKEPLRAAQLYHIPLALLRADDILMLPPPTEDGNTDEGSSPVKQYRHSDFRSYVGSAWARMELALAAVGQANVHVTFRGDPYPESVGKLSAGKCNVDELTKQAVGCLRLAATGVDEKSGSKSAVGTITGGTYVEQNTVAVAAAVDGACDNWLGSDLNPLAVLEEIRAVVTAAEKSSDAHVLESIQGMRPTPTAEYMKDARASLGQERVEGAKELALSVLLFAVLCSQPKERATYTDGFVENAGKMEILYRPIAVVRSPYRERFGTPRQPQVTASVLHGGAQEGEIVFLKGHGYEEALENLSGFDMIWVISHMHLNKGWNCKVRPPRLPEERKGLFSTRSPHRPNPLALSSLRVNRVDAAKGIIYVLGLDLLDGTPVLDIKPYIGYCDAFPDMKAGWLDALGLDHETQGDFLPKFSVGATLVHTVVRSKSSEGCLADPVSGKPTEQDSEEAS